MPDFKYKSMSLNPFNPKASFALQFKVKNPNSFNLNLSSLKYDFTAANQKVIGGAQKNVQVPPGQERPLSIPVNLRGKEIIQLAPKLREFRKHAYKLSGEMNIDVIGQTLKLPYSVP